MIKTSLKRQISEQSKALGVSNIRHGLTGFLWVINYEFLFGRGRVCRSSTAHKLTSLGLDQAVNPLNYLTSLSKQNKSLAVCLAQADLEFLFCLLSCRITGMCYHAWLSSPSVLRTHRSGQRWFECCQEMSVTIYRGGQLKDNQKQFSNYNFSNTPSYDCNCLLLCNLTLLCIFPVSLFSSMPVLSHGLLASLCCCRPL